MDGTDPVDTAILSADIARVMAKLAAHREDVDILYWTSDGHSRRIRALELSFMAAVDQLGQMIAGVESRIADIEPGGRPQPQPQQIASPFRIDLTWENPNGDPIHTTIRIPVPDGAETLRYLHLMYNKTRVAAEDFSPRPGGRSFH